MKKILLLCAAAIFAFAACKDKDGDGASGSKAYSINLAGATSSPSGSARVGTVVTLTPIVPDRMHFARWDSPDVAIRRDKEDDKDKFLMPTRDVNIKAIFKDNVFTITLDYGLAFIDRQEVQVAEQDAVVTLTHDNLESEGKRFVGWTCDDPEVVFTEGEDIELSDYPVHTFTMPDHAVVLSAEYEDILYNISVVSSVSGGGGASVSVDGTMLTNPMKTTYGKTVKLTPVETFDLPAGTYEFSEFDVTAGGIKPNAANEFKMPAGDVAITVRYKLEAVPQAPYLLYWSGTKLGLGQWGQETVTRNNILFVKYGSLIGVGRSPASYNNSAVLFNPTSIPLENLDEWMDIPCMSSSHFSSLSVGTNNDVILALHTKENVEAGRGDICRLVGLTKDEIAAKLAAGTLHEYNSGYRIPNKDVFPEYITANRPITLAGIDGATTDGSAETFVPLVGHRTVSEMVTQGDYGLLYQEGTASYCLTSTVEKASNGGLNPWLMLVRISWAGQTTLHTASKVDYANNDFRSGGIVRCVPN